MTPTCADLITDFSVDAVSDEVKVTLFCRKMGLKVEYVRPVADVALLDDDINEFTTMLGSMMSGGDS